MNKLTQDDLDNFCNSRKGNCVGCPMRQIYTCHLSALNRKQRKILMGWISKEATAHA